MISDINQLQIFVHSRIKEIESTIDDVDNQEDYYSMIGEKNAFNEVLDFIKEVIV